MTSPHPETPLSPREIDVIRVVASGLTNTEIANRLVISPGTLLRHIANISEKTGAENRQELTVYAITHGLVDEAN